MIPKLLLAGLFAACAFGQDYRSAEWTAPISTRNTTPGVCRLGQMFIRSDQTAGQNLYVCGSHNDWSLVGGGGGGGSVTVPNPPGAMLFNDAGALGGTTGLSWLGDECWTMVSDPPFEPAVALAGQGAGNTSNGSYSFSVTFATAEGETYDVGTSIEVVDHTLDGKILFTDFPPITDFRVTGWNLYALSPEASVYRLAAFIPKGTGATYLYDLSDADLATHDTSATLSQINSTGPYVLGDGGRGPRQVLQYFDSGVRFSAQLFWDRLVGHDGSFITASGGFMGHVDPGVTQTIVVKGSAGANCNLVVSKGLITGTTCP